MHLGLMCFPLAELQNESLSLPKKHHLRACDWMFQVARSVLGAGASSLFLATGCVLGLARTVCVSPLPDQ